MVGSDKGARRRAYRPCRLRPGRTPRWQPRRAGGNRPGYRVALGQQAGDPPARVLALRWRDRPYAWLATHVARRVASVLFS